MPFKVVNKPLMIIFYFHSPGSSVEVPVVVSRPLGANMEASVGAIVNYSQFSPMVVLGESLIITVATD